RRDAVQRLAERNERAFLRRIFNRPCLAAIAAAREQMFLRPLAVDVVTLRAEVLVIACAEADEDFVAPRPESVIGGPSAEASRPGKNFDVPDARLARRIRARRRIGAEQPAFVEHRAVDDSAFFGSEYEVNLPVSRLNGVRVGEVARSFPDVAAMRKGF